MSELAVTARHQAPSGRIGLIGVGVMGLPMARNLAAGGGMPVVFDIDATACARAAAIADITVAESPAAVAAACSIVFTCLPSEAAVREVFLGANGIANAAHAGLITAECCTISPELAEELAHAMAACGVRHLETLLIGRWRQAEQRQLYFLVSGDAALLPAIEPALRLMGRTWRHVGPSGAANRVKLLQNGLGYAAGVAVTEILGLCRGLGIDPLTVRRHRQRGRRHRRLHLFPRACGRCGGAIPAPAGSPSPPRTCIC